ncbi:hypothetical protein [Undibacterium baiyunense]|uniref:Nucleotidyltransferase AbiEii toxin of type IV toxin-antitoxin system n=1 Tax=Undibacterium baiyunense TaxID=2828731 RepID=A0A941DKD2_9BURK|nr:hypothetical protein [Undibacterium baiyunense]MBR7747762.1 hypothetical protein [Undibacterium baiyunense]
MSPHDPNIAMIELVAKHLGDMLLDEVVFVGGAVAGLLITDPAQPAIRPTEDVDMIVQVIAHSDYYQLEKRLRERGFIQDLQAEAPICRWKIQSITVDLMPTLEEILGFSNRWYGYALEMAQRIVLPSGCAIRCITAPLFLATKLEAFSGRGNDDYLFSHDLGDLLAIIDGRETIITECAQTKIELREYFRDRLRALLQTPAFVQALPGHLPGDAASQARLPELHEKIRLLAGLVEIENKH